MNVDNRQEMAERFRLYGEIFMLCVDIAGDDDMDGYEITYDEISTEMACDCFEVEPDDGDSRPFDGIHFEDSLLWVDYGIFSSQFVDVTSVTLQKIVELLERYKEIDV